MTSASSPLGALERQPVGQEDLTRLRMTLGQLGRLLRQQSVDDLPYALISLIFAIYREQPVTAGELAEREGVTPPSVTRSLNRLFELGLISREPLQSDRRATVIRLTDKGVTERSKLLQSRELWLVGHIQRLSAEELDKLIKALPALERLCRPLT